MGKDHPMADDGRFHARDDFLPPSPGSKSSHLGNPSRRFLFFPCFDAISRSMGVGGPIEYMLRLA